MNWIEFLDTKLPQWWNESPAPGIGPLREWSLWTKSKEVVVSDPDSFSYPEGRMNEIFFRMVLDQQYGGGKPDPFIKIYENVRKIGDLRQIRKEMCNLETLQALGKEGGGYWRFRKIPLALIENVDRVVKETQSKSFEKFLHRIVQDISGNNRFRFPDLEDVAERSSNFANLMVEKLLSSPFKLKGVGPNMASYALRHLQQIPGATRLIKADYHNQKLGDRRIVEEKLVEWSEVLIRKNVHLYSDAERMFSPAGLNMAIYLKGILEKKGLMRGKDVRKGKTKTPIHGFQKMRMLDRKNRQLANTLISEIKQLHPGIVEKPTKFYLGLKLGNRLICALYPCWEKFNLGHWMPPEGGPKAEWKTPFIQNQADLKKIQPFLLERIRFVSKEK